MSVSENSFVKICNTSKNCPESYVCLTVDEYSVVVLRVTFLVWWW